MLHLALDRACVITITNERVWRNVFQLKKHLYKLIHQAELLSTKHFETNIREICQESCAANLHYILNFCCKLTRQFMAYSHLS